MSENKLYTLHHTPPSLYILKDRNNVSLASIHLNDNFFTIVPLINVAPPFGEYGINISTLLDFLHVKDDEKQSVIKDLRKDINNLIDVDLDRVETRWDFNGYSLIVGGEIIHIISNGGVGRKTGDELKVLLSERVIERLEREFITVTPEQMEVYTDLLFKEYLNSHC